MARGWESKDIEAQQELRPTRGMTNKPPLTALQLEVERKRAVLLLSRTRVLGDLQRACHARHRGQLEAALAHVDAELAALPPAAVR
jgi:hypothetical protein